MDRNNVEGEAIYTANVANKGSIKLLKKKSALNERMKITRKS